ncbi:MAG: DNA polymerase III subunit beta [Candidatus Acidiferrales bacterium]
MEFTVDTSKFAEALEQIQGAVDKKNTIPILSHCLIGAEPQGLRLAATDLELGMRLSCPAQVKEAGSAAIPAHRLLDIVKSLPDGAVRVHALENQRIQVNSGRSTFKLAAMSKDNFPAMPEAPQPLAALAAGVLAGLIERTAFAMSNEESRYTLNSVLLVLKDGSAEMVATDGSRLPLAARDVEANGFENEERLLIPKRAVASLRRLANAQEPETPIRIAKDDRHLFFTAGDALLTTRMITGQFPNYEAVLPKSNGIAVTLDAGAFREALERVSLLASEQRHGVSLALESGRITLSATGGDAGEATESVDAAYSGEPLQVGFNYLFLLDFLSAVKTGEVEIALKDDTSAAEFRPADPAPYQYRCVIMPMRS